MALNDRASATARVIGDDWLLGITVNNAGDALMAAGEFEPAQSRFAEALALGRARDDRIRIGMSLGNLGIAAFAVGGVAEARDFFVATLDAAAVTRALDATAQAILGLGLVACDRDPARGATLAAAAAMLVAQQGGSLQEFEEGLRERALARARDALGDEAFDRAVAAGEELSLDDAIALARDCA